MRVAVVGGGIAGLSAAWELSGDAEVTVLEPGRLGGRILTEPFEGRNVEAGPDAFITRVPYALDLCAELGIDDLVEPSAGRTLIWWEGRTRQLPEGLVLGVPRRLGPMIRSGLIGPVGLLRAAGDLVLPPSRFDGDVSVRELVARRFGGQVADRLVDPLVGGIHAGSIDSLSAEATMPQLLQAARGSRSLLAGLRRAGGTGAGGSGAIFATPRDGLRTLVEALTSELNRRSVRIAAVEASAVSGDAAGWRVEPLDEAFDAVVVATPAAAAARLLGPGSPPGLRSILTASVALVTFGYPEMEIPPGVNGILVPRSSGLLATACSFASSKWPHWAAPGRTVLRVSAGRFGDERAMAMGDGDLAARLAEEVATMAGWDRAPDSSRVSRWPDAFPQYGVGHLSLVRGVEDGLRRDFPGVEICGSSYGGAGIPACIASGRAAGRRVTDRLRAAGRR
ncbi:MAG TPA: protoporphyrinogen oxidase [Acidimicrobiales bacterium]|nr:protoporphyrinogen oxidase [Acidimicrobiales bacterium]